MFQSRCPVTSSRSEQTLSEWFALFLFLILATSSSAQPIQLFKDISPGTTSDEHREIIQTVTTPDSVYIVSRRSITGGLGGRMYLNSSNGRDYDRNIGSVLGSSFIYDDTMRYGPDFPFIAIRDGKVMFSTEPGQWKELDGTTGETKLLFGGAQDAYYAWTGAGGRVCFVSVSDTVQHLNVGYLKGTDDPGTTVTATIPEAPEVLTNFHKVGDAVVLGDILIFALLDNENQKVAIWRTDGSSTGTERLYVLENSAHKDVTIIKTLGKCFIGINENTGTTHLLATDGTATGTQVLASNTNLRFRVNSRGDYAASTTTLYWIADPFAGEPIWSSDGTPGGTSPVTATATPDYYYLSMAWVGNHLFLNAHDNFSGEHLLKTDGVSTPTAVVNLPAPISSIWAYTATSTGTLFATDAGVFFTAGSIADAEKISSYSSLDEKANHPGIWPFGDKALFNTRIPSRLTEQLWASNPEFVLAPVPLTKFTYLPFSSDPHNFAVAGSHLFFGTSKKIPFQVDENYSTDGTSENTISFGGGEPTIIWMGAAGDEIVYTYPDDIYRSAPSVSGVYSSDGTGDIEVLVDSSMVQQDTTPAPLFSIGDVFYFGICDTLNYPFLHKTDGTPVGTQPVWHGFGKNIVHPLKPIGVAGNKGIFYARTTGTATAGYAIFGTDGTEAGTMQIGFSETPPIKGATVAGGRVVFSASWPGAGHELMITDGTQPGTQLMNDFLPGMESSNPRNFVSADDDVYFIADDTLSPTAVWRTNGTGNSRMMSLYEKLDQNENLVVKSSVHGGVYVSGTFQQYSRIYYVNGVFLYRLVAEYPLEAEPDLLGEVNGLMYLAMTTPELGRELYRTVGYIGAPELVQDFAPGSGSGATMKDAGVLGNKIFFAANSEDMQIGSELYHIEVLDTGVNDWQLY